MDIIKEWIDSGMDYNDGVAIYETHCKNRILLKLFKRNLSIANHKKLQYELSKLLPHQIIEKPIKSVQNPSSSENVDEIIEFQLQQYESKQMELIKQLPPEMLEVLFTANLKWKENCRLKVQLNMCPAELEDIALQIQLKIDANWKENKLCWKQIDYYLEHKILPKVPESDYSNLTAPELVKRQQYHFSTISRLKKRITENRKKLSENIDTRKKSKIERSLAKQESDLLKKEAELQTLTNLVNGK